MQAVKVQTSLGIGAGSSESSVLAYAMSTKISLTGTFQTLMHYERLKQFFAISTATEIPFQRVFFVSSFCFYKTAFKER